MTDPFDRLWYISRKGWGRIVMDIHNIRVVKCRKCSGSISPGVGFKFIAERFGADPSGFLCKGCVGKEMIDVKEWHYNQITGTLFPA